MSYRGCRLGTNSAKCRAGFQTQYNEISELKILMLIAFVKERFHNAVEIDILGIFEGYS